jgi:hypothetical protein
VGEQWVPQDYIGGAVPVELVVARTADTACVVQHLAAHPDGFSFLFVVRAREAQKTIFEGAETLLHNYEEPGERQGIHLRVELSDGTVIGVPRSGRHADDPVLFAAHGGGGHEGFAVEYHVDLLPPLGTRLTFVCDWAPRGIHDARAGLDGDLLVEAAKRAERLWA